MRQPFPDPTDDGSILPPSSPSTPPPAHPACRSAIAYPFHAPCGFLPGAEDSPAPAPVSELTAVVWEPEVAARLDTLRARHAHGDYPDDVMAHLNAHRLAFARWLRERGAFTED